MSTHLSPFLTYLKTGKFSNGKKCEPQKRSSKKNTIVSCKVRDEENIKYEQYMKRFIEKYRIRQKDKNRSCSPIIKKHHDELKDDPEHLTTEFLINLIGCDCKRMEPQGGNNISPSGPRPPSI